MFETCNNLQGHHAHQLLVISYLLLSIMSSNQKDFPIASFPYLPLHAVGLHAILLGRVKVVNTINYVVYV